MYPARGASQGKGRQAAGAAAFGLFLACLLPSPVAALGRVPAGPTRPPDTSARAPVRIVRPAPEQPPASTLRPPASSLQDSDLQDSSGEGFLSGQLRLSNQLVERSNRRLRHLGGGAVGVVRESEEDRFTTLLADLHGTYSLPLTEDLVLLVEDRFRTDGHDPERIDSERYDFLDNRFNIDLGALVGDGTLVDLGGFLDHHDEKLVPRFRFRSAGGHLAVDWPGGELRNWTAKLEQRRTTFEDIPIENHDQTRVGLGFLRYLPSTIEVDRLPFPPEEPVQPPETFDYARELELDRARAEMLDLGAGRVVRASRVPEEIPRHRKLMGYHVGRRETAFGIDGAYTRREADTSTAGSFDRGTGRLFGRKATSEHVVWTLEDQLDFTDHDAEDLSRFLFDRLDNRASLERSSLESDSVSVIRGSVESIFATDRTDLDSHRLVLDQFSAIYFGRRYGWTSWFRGFKRLGRRPALDYPEYEGFKTRSTFTVEFGRKSALDLTLAYERIAVQGLQTELDSTFAQRTLEARYKRRLGDRVRVELGLSDEQETHEAFFQNNRDEQVLFLDLVAEL